MAEQTIDKLQIELEARAGRSVSNIEKLAQSLDRLKAVTAGGVSGLSKTAAALDRLQSAAAGLKGRSSALTSIAKSLNTLSAVRLPATERLSEFANAFSGFGGAVESMREFRSGVGSLRTAFNNLDKIKFEGMAARIRQLVDAIRPLTDEMIRGGKYAGDYGTQIKALVSAAKQTNAIQKGYDSRGTAVAAHRSESASWSFTKFQVAVDAIRGIGNTIGGFVTEINDYIEDLNLFTVAMGDFADQGLAFAEKMQTALGINAGEAMRYMGVFQQMATSMGFTQERAYTLSTTLTQLGYDWSSFYNLDTEESFTKLQAAISGEIEPVRRLGIDISSARLQQELYNLGIQESVENLNQADKATLRYIALLKQSENAMGDLSRSIESPSNALRLLNAQWEVAKREIGSVFIPMLLKILPPAIAVVRILGEMARSLANLLGFELPTIDYSSVGNLSVGLTDAADSADNLTDSVKETKKEISGLLGFDEINALTETETGSSGSSASANTDMSSVLGDVELPTYDMFTEIENSVDQWVEKIKDGISRVWDVIEPFMPLIEGLGIVFATAFAFDWVKGSLTKIKPLSWITDFFTLARKGLKWFSNDFKKSHNTWETAANGIKKFRKKIPTAAKIVAGLATIAAEFVVVKNSLGMAYDGTISWAQAITQTGIAAGVAGGVLYALFGPAGLVAAAATLMAGVVAADLEHCRKLEEAAFYAENGGTKISEVAEMYSAWSDEIVRANEELINNHAQIEEAQGKISDITGEIETLNKQYEIGAISAEEYLPKITDAINTLHDETYETLDKIRDNIMLALSGSIGESLASAGVDLPAFVQLINDSVESTKTALDKSRDNLINLAAELSTLTEGTEEYTEKNKEWMDEFDKMRILSGNATNQELTDLSDKLTEISDNIDFESPESFKTAMEEIKTATDDAYTSVETSWNDTISYLEDLQSRVAAAGNEDLANQLGEKIIEFSTIRDDDLAKITEKNKETAQQIQSSFSEHLQKTFEESSPSLFDYILPAFLPSYGRDLTAEDFMRQRIEDDITGPLAEAFKDCFGEDLYVAAESAVNGIPEGMTSEVSTASMLTGMQDVSDTLTSGFVRSQGLDTDNSVMETLGNRTVMSLSMGMSTGRSELEKTSEDLSSSIRDGVKTLPSEMETSGQKITDGFLLGLNGLNSDTDSKLSQLSNKFSGWSAVLRTPHLSWDMDGLKTSGVLKQILETLNLPTSLPKLSVEWYAQGGIFNSPQIIGVGERGPEAVVPLSDNAAWIEALSESIARREAQITNYNLPERYDNRGGDWTFIIQREDGTTESEFTLTAAERSNTRSGKTIIPVGV